MQCRMSQNEVLMPNFDASNGEQATRCRNVAVRGRKFGISTRGRSKTFQLNIKMMNFSKASRRKRSSRGRTERYNAGPSLESERQSERGCEKGKKTVGENENYGHQNCCVRDILLQSTISETPQLFTIWCSYPRYPIQWNRCQLSIIIDISILGVIVDGVLGIEEHRATCRRRFDRPSSVFTTFKCHKGQNSSIDIY